MSDTLPKTSVEREESLDDSSVVQRPIIFGYLDFRQFLSDFVVFLRMSGTFSARKFALQVGFKSPSYLKMIIDGQRNIGPEVVQKLCTTLDLKKDESQFFEKLVLFNQTKLMDLKDKLYEEILSFKKFRSIRNLDSARYEFYSRWYMPVVYESVGHVDWAKSKEDFAKRIGITIPEIDRSLEILEKLGLIEKRRRDWIKTDTAIETDPDASSLYIRNFHREMILRAQQTLDGVAPEERDLQGLTLALSHEDFLEFKKALFDFISKMNKRFSTPEKPTAIYQLSTQFFSLVKLPSSDSAD